MPPIDALQRREHKFLVPLAVLRPLREWVSVACTPDRHAETGGYVVRSLYLDGPGLPLLRAHLAGAADRYKVRVRAYGDAPGSCWLEVKRRTGEVVRKTRVEVPTPSWPQLLDRTATGDPGVDAWLDRIHLGDLSPVLAVTYRREAWSSDLDPYARVTIDTQVRAGAADAEGLRVHADELDPIDTPTHTNTPQPCALLELKFEGSPPRWMKSMVRALELQRAGFSKYVAGSRTAAARPTRRAVA